MKKLGLLVGAIGGMLGLIVGLLMLSGGSTEAASSDASVASLPPDGSGHLTFSSLAAQDVGKIDPRLTQLLSEAPFDLHVSVFITGHSLHVKGTDNISNHIYGRAADINEVNGEHVSRDSQAAKAFMQWLTTASPQPTEVGSPFPEFNNIPGRFSNPDHATHLHVAWD